MTPAAWLLILHGLVAVALLGALTHQSVACVRAPARAGNSFTRRYTSVNPAVFAKAIIVSYVATFVLGSVIYPDYRLDVRVALSEMQLGWGIGLFEIKEHSAALGLALLPLYYQLWKRQPQPTWAPAGRTATTLVLAAVVWFNFMVGHLLNNFRGL